MREGASQDHPGPRLEVRLHGRTAGTLKRMPDGLLFTYDEAYLEHRGARALGVQLPLAPGPSEPGKAGRWFGELLPEGGRRDAIGRQAGVASQSAYAMLAVLGGECAGAVQVLDPEAKHIGWAQRAWTTAVEDYIDAMIRRPLGEEGLHMRVAVAGAQPKLALRWSEGKWWWPDAQYPSTHILKTEKGNLKGIVENEHACMTLAQRSGVIAAATEIVEFGGRKALAVRRFDRDDDRRGTHQEDLVQALGMSEKYERLGGPRLAACFEAPEARGWALWQQVMFGWLVGDEDRHAKNTSLQYHERWPARVAPLYDCLSTRGYEKLSRRMAMKIGQAGEIDEVDEGAIRRQAGACGLPEKQAVGRLKGLAREVRISLDEMEKERFDTGALEAGGIRARLDAVATWSSE